MASSRRLRQESKTSDSTAPLPSYRGRERSSSTCTCGRNCAFPIGCSGLQCNGNGTVSGNGNGVGARDANDFHQNNSMSSTGPNGLEVKVIKGTLLSHLCCAISMPSCFHFFVEYRLPSTHFYNITVLYMDEEYRQKCK